MNQKEKLDPIRDKYYVPLENAERWSDFLFYASAGLSLAAPIISSGSQPNVYDFVQGAFVICVVAVFIIGWVIRYRLAPRAQHRRFQDFLTHAFGVQLSDDKTENYYTSETNHPTMRIALQLLENCFYSKDTAHRMASGQCWRIGIYAALFVMVILNRSTDLGVVAILAQIVFSEQILSRWLRTEWLWRQFEVCYDDLFRLLQSRSSGVAFTAMSWEILIRYEAAKANACVTLSSRVFDQRRTRTMAEWERVRRMLPQ